MSILKPLPLNQKFLPGQMVEIDDYLGPLMKGLPGGRLGKVVYSYGQAQNNEDGIHYTLDIYGYGNVYWYHESVLKLYDPNSGVI